MESKCIEIEKGLMKIVKRLHRTKTLEYSRYVRPKPASQIEDWKCDDGPMIEEELKKQQALLNVLHQQVSLCPNTILLIDRGRGSIKIQVFLEKHIIRFWQTLFISRLNRTFAERTTSLVWKIITKFRRVEDE